MSRSIATTRTVASTRTIASVRGISSGRITTDGGGGGGGNGLLNSLMAYWNMDEAALAGGEDRADATGRGNYLSDINITVSSAAGILGNSADCDGVDCNLQLTSNDLDIVADMTISVWIYFTGLVYINTIFDLRAVGDFITLYGDNGELFAQTDLDTLSFGALPTNQWAHIVLRQTGGLIEGFLNNVSVGAIVGATPSANNALYVGVDTYANYFWLGRIDEMGKWNAALTNTQISQLYNSGAGLPYTSFD